MTYLYECSVCGMVERRCMVDDRDKQVCECGNGLKRLFSDGLNIMIPVSFSAEFGDCMPQTEQGKADWKKNVVPAGKSSRWL